ncbi:hypothetical protein Droror1_Dr00024932 [Drosera rotundifolia]
MLMTHSRLITILHMMAFLKLFLILVLLAPTFQALVEEPSRPREDGIQAMIARACVDVEDEISCLSNVQSKLSSYQQLNATSVLLAATEATLNEALLTIAMLTRFTLLSTSRSREQIAIEDCKELLDFTVTELSWSLTEMRMLRSPTETTGKYVQHHEHEGNLKAWLSAALGNQDTCLEGFQGTNQDTKNMIKGNLKQVTQLVSNILTMYTQFHASPFTSPRDNNYTIEVDEPKFPEWITEGNKEILVASPKGIHVDAVVAVDGTGKYRSIAQAIQEAPSYSNRKYVIYVKKGVYNENIDMKRKKANIMMIGDGIGETVISGNRNFMQGWTTFRTATFGKSSFHVHHAVSGQGFIARDITFRNTAGPFNRQAAALRVDSDRSAFFRCSIEGYQDTLYAHSLRQFYRDCHIHGTIDFLFGNGAAVFQNCDIHVREPLPPQKPTIAAQGRKSPSQSTGFVVQDSRIQATLPTYLGRPWRAYSRVVYMNCYLGPGVQPRGWLEWYGGFGLGTSYFGEYRNYGPGAGLAGRVTWPGYHILGSTSEAVVFTVRWFIDGLSWLPATGVQFSSGLSN